MKTCNNADDDSQIYLGAIWNEAGGPYLLSPAGMSMVILYQTPDGGECLQSDNINREY